MGALLDTADDRALRQLYLTNAIHDFFTINLTRLRRKVQVSPKLLRHEILYIITMPGEWLESSSLRLKFLSS